MEQPVGTCSICGGEVRGHVGAWWGVVPPPAARCTSCGAVEAKGPVIPMRPASPQRIPRVVVERVTIDRPVTFEPWTAYHEHRNTSHAIGVWCPA